jgi:3'-phosphoadenosine 5'-phosphosulfate sulfotransferase (PAPS reductase)/FAD synthetase
MDSGNIYFVIYTNNKQSVTVIDLASCVAYERSDWNNVNDYTFYSHTEAIEYARSLAERYGLEYERFESRYNNELDENPEEDYIY